MGRGARGRAGRPDRVDPCKVGEWRQSWMMASTGRRGRLRGGGRGQCGGNGEEPS